MTGHLSPVERDLLKFIERLPMGEDEKSPWVESLQTSGLTEDLAEEMRKRLSVGGEEENPMERTRQMASLILLIRRWRLEKQKKNFKRR
jgi:hypothetical protein